MVKEYFKTMGWGLIGAVGLSALGCIGILAVELVGLYPKIFSTIFFGGALVAVIYAIGYAIRDIRESI